MPRANKFPCTVCDHVSKRKEHLEIHMRQHTGLKPYCCDVEGCGQSFAQSAHLRHHMFVHEDLKPYCCDRCPVSFRTSGHLSLHKRVHDDLKPYTCDYPGCNQSFRQIHHLKQHVLQHSDNKPHVCSYEGCSAAFRLPLTLQVHTRTHTGERPFRCDFPECGLACITSSNLAVHYKRIHTEEGQQRQKKKEERVAKLLTAHGVDFRREHRITFSCWGGTCARIDFVILVAGGVLMLEVDEFQHDSYAVSCELSRMMNLYEACMLDGNTQPLGFLRYNPDSYKVDGVSVKKQQKERERILLETIASWAPGQQSTMSIMYMFYDVTTVDGVSVPVIWADPAFDDNLKACCRPSVV